MNIHFSKTLLVVGLIIAIGVGVLVGTWLTSTQSAKAKNGLQLQDYVCFKLKGQNVEGKLVWQYLNQKFSEDVLRESFAGSFEGPTLFCTPIKKLKAHMEF